MNRPTFLMLCFKARHSIPAVRWIGLPLDIRPSLTKTCCYYKGLNVLLSPPLFTVSHATNKFPRLESFVYAGRTNGVIEESYGQRHPFAGKRMRLRLSDIYHTGPATSLLAGICHTNIILCYKNVLFHFFKSIKANGFQETFQKNITTHPLIGT